VKKMIFSINLDMKRLYVDFDEIQKAMEDVVRDTFDYFLDLETGEVMPLSEEIVKELKARLSDDDLEEIEEDIEYIEFDEEPEIPDWMTDEMEMVLEILLDESGRYIRIPERENRTAYQTMNDFLESVVDPFMKEKLFAALNGKGAFRKFKDTLVSFPRERKRWHGFNAKAMRKEIHQWLKSLEIQAVPLQKPR
jgi:hypothetical protein